jgi:glycosyltransferase involved in cell wall biosynthesis
MTIIHCFEKRKLWIERLILKQADSWICVSDPILHWAKEKVNYSKAILINNPVNENRFSKISVAKKQEKGIHNVVMIANYKAHKDYFNLLRAIKQIENEFPEYQFQCYGGNTESAYYKELLSYKQNGNFQNVELFPSSNNIPGVLSSAAVGVLSSVSEGLPISLLEYMAEGLPVVVTDVGDCGRIVRDAKNGLIVPAQSPVSLANALRYLLKNQNEWEMMSRNGSEFIAQYFSLPSFVSQVVKLYRSIVLV